MRFVAGRRTEATVAGLTEIRHALHRALWHQLDKGQLTLKKPYTPASTIAPTCKPHGVSGRQPN